MQSNKIPVLVHCIKKGYFPQILFCSQFIHYNFIYSTNPDVLLNWRGPIVILGIWDPAIAFKLSNRPPNQRLVYIVIDAFDTLNLL